MTFDMQGHFETIHKISQLIESERFRVYDCEYRKDNNEPVPPLKSEINICEIEATQQSKAELKREELKRENALALSSLEQKPIPLVTKKCEAKGKTKCESKEQNALAKCVALNDKSLPSSNRAKYEVLSSNRATDKIQRPTMENKSTNTEKIKTKGKHKVNTYYFCFKCGYETIYKSSLENHIIRSKNGCSPLRDMEKYLQKIRDKINTIITAYNNISKLENNEAMLLKIHKDLCNYQKIVEHYSHEFEDEERNRLDESIKTLREYLINKNIIDNI